MIFSGKTIVITSRSEPAREGLMDHEIRVPETSDTLPPSLAGVPPPAPDRPRVGKPCCGTSFVMW